ncbi:MAG TPA: hypothetical protein VM223_17465 [Planctomycetota bacterium]|nr:hypothetical protein [Planctomycetota bacterium]
MDDLRDPTAESEFGMPGAVDRELIVVERVDWIVRAWRCLGPGRECCELACYALHPKMGFEFGTPAPNPGCDNLAYSILRACVPADVAYQWWQWFAWYYICPKKSRRWTVSVGEVRDLVKMARVWFGRESLYRSDATPVAMDPPETFATEMHEGLAETATLGRGI